jgi:hypothetical protein
VSLSQLPTNSHLPLTAICFLPQSAGNLTESALFTEASIDDISGRQPPITPNEAATILFNRYASDAIEPLPWDTRKIADKFKLATLKHAFKSAVKGYVSIVLRRDHGRETLKYKVVKAYCPSPSRPAPRH